MNHSRKLRVNLIVTLLSAAISLTSFLYLTYAWFGFIHNNDIDVMTIQTVGNISYELKYFTKNYDSVASSDGYPDPNSFLNSADRITVDDYATDFLPIEQDPHLNGGQTVVTAAQFPGLRLTYALEVTGDFTEDKEVFLSLTNYVATPSSTLYDATTLQPISMASATNIYATVIDGNTDVTTSANSFITNTSPTDLFTTSASSGPCSILLGSRILSAGETPADLVVFIFTLDYSNLASTFYEFSYTSSGLSYYLKDVEGNSNVYKNLAFALTELSLSLS